jgi:hypothetical protein
VVINTEKIRKSTVGSHLFGYSVRNFGWIDVTFARSCVVILAFVINEDERKKYNARTNPVGTSRELPVQDHLAD